MTEKSQAQTYMAELLLALKSRGFTNIIINERPNGRVVFNAITAKYREQHFGLLFDKRGITLFEGAEMRDDQALVSWAYLRWQAITDDRGGIITQEIEHTLCTHILHIPGPGRPTFVRANQAGTYTAAGIILGVNMFLRHTTANENVRREL